MKQVLLWIEAFRPKTLIASIAPVIFGTLLAKTTGSHMPFVSLCALLTSLALQITTNLFNDYYDFLWGADKQRDKYGPRRLASSGKVPATHVYNAAWISWGITALLGGYLSYIGGFLVGVLMLISLFLTYAYTAGPFPIAYMGLGEIFVLLFFGPIATVGCYYLQTHTLQPLAIWLGLVPGLNSCSMLILNNLRDIHEDALAQKWTLPARFGPTFGKLEFIFMHITSLGLIKYLNLLPLSLWLGLAFFSFWLCWQVWVSPFEKENAQSLFGKNVLYMIIQTILIATYV